jgi:hypothetical protein
MSEWQDMIVGDRMAVDSEFARQVDNSQFSRQEWGLIMTATTFEIERPDDAEAAELVADTSKLPTVMPELERMSEMGPMGAPQDAGGGGAGGGLVSSIMSTLGLDGVADGGDDLDEDTLEAAESMVAAYADELQGHLEEDGRWSEVRRAAAAEGE